MRLGILLVAAVLMLFYSCGIYTFRDVSVPADVKTIKIGFIENRARYINPQLSPQLTDAFQQKVNNYTKLNRTNDEEADYVINSYVNSYSVSTSGISNGQTANNRLTVGVHVTFINNRIPETKEFDISRDFEFSATQSLQQAEAILLTEIIRNVSDEMFNRIFSNW
jgi:hypothetical protein